MTFDLKATAYCDRCGAALGASDEDCGECSTADLHRYTFEHLVQDRGITFRAIPGRQWHDLADRVDDPLPWRETRSGMTSLHWRQQAGDDEWLK